MLLVPLIGFVTGFGFAAFGVTVAAVAKTIDNFNYITSAVLTPLFLVAGTFFPISNCPTAARRSRSSTRSITACSSCATPRSPTSARCDLGHAAVLLAFALLMWRLAIAQLGRRLID